MDNPPVIPMFADGDDAAHGYMCLTDFEFELGNASSPSRVYSDPDTLREKMRCVGGCGIVKVEVRALEIIQAPTEDFRGETGAAENEEGAK